MKLQILGNGAALPSNGRLPTAQIVDIKGKYLLIDAGEGVQVALQNWAWNTHKIEYIFISHLHGDHYFGLFGLLGSMNLQGRTQALTLFAPPDLFPIIKHIQLIAQSEWQFPLTVIALDQLTQLLVDNDDLQLLAFQVQHRIPCWGLRVEEKFIKRKINVSACSHYQIPHYFYKQLQYGSDYESKNGVIIKNETLTFPSKKNHVYVYSADTLYHEEIIQFCTHAQWLYHEATYLSDDEDKAFSRFHATARQAAQIAAKANVNLLLLGHYSSRYKDIRLFEDEAKAIFSNSVATEQGDIFQSD